MFYIVGLGNPGDQYKNTRHNVGRSFLETWSAAQGYDWNKSAPAQALYAHAALGDTSVELVLPETFMNRSGETLKYYVEKHAATIDQFIVLHDDIDLALGEIKISRGRGDGGNNGVRSIIEHLGSKDFVRVRIGIAPRHWWTGEVKRPAGGGALERYVLQPFTRREQARVAELEPQITTTLEEVVKNGPEAAMNRFN